MELSISRLLPVLSAEQERQQHRKLVLTELEAYHRHGRDLLERARELLGDGDPAIRQLAALVSQGERAVLRAAAKVASPSGFLARFITSSAPTRVAISSVKSDRSAATIRSAPARRAARIARRPIGPQPVTSTDLPSIPPARRVA